MDSNEIAVKLMRVSVSLITKKTRDITVEDEDAPDGEVHVRIEVPLARPYLSVNCILESVLNNAFVPGHDYVDGNQFVYHATNTETIVLVTKQMESFNTPEYVILLNTPYKEGSNA